MARAKALREKITAEFAEEPQRARRRKEGDGGLRGVRSQEPTLRGTRSAKAPSSSLEQRQCGGTQEHSQEWLGHNGEPRKGGKPHAYKALIEERCVDS
jgi:hypothetical protein